MAQLLAVLQKIALYLRLGLSRVPRATHTSLMPGGSIWTLLYSNQTHEPLRILIQSQGLIGGTLLLRHTETGSANGIVLEDLEAVEWVFFPGDRVYGFTTGAAVLVQVSEIGR